MNFDNGRERHLILNALSLAVAAMEATSRTMLAESDLADIQELLSSLADSVELDMYANSALNVIAGIVDRQEGRAEG